MKNEQITNFVRLGRKGKPMLIDDEIALYPREYYGYSKRIHCDHTLIFDIVEIDSDKIAGEIALRVGDSAEQFYLGHIGYHVDPPFRGHAYAAKACALCGALLRGLGLRTIVITTDPDNRPSIKTCTKLGCELECRIAVPPQMQDILEISKEKNRYIWTLSQT